jgi:hypothetical protein
MTDYFTLFDDPALYNNFRQPCKYHDMRPYLNLRLSL